MSLSKKRKKELRKLQDSANTLWESQRALAGQAAGVAKEAGRQLGNLNREQVAPVVEAKYKEYVEPYVEKATPYVDRGRKATQKFVDNRLVPAAGTVVGKALSAWDVANETRVRLAAKRGDALPVVEVKRKRSAGPIIALLLGIAAAGAVLYAAWQTLRADDELWVSDDPLAAPEA